MKRLVSLFVCLVVALCPLFAHAESLNIPEEEVHSFFADYSLDNLLLLQKLVEIELKYRGQTDSQLTEMIIPAGEYIVGTDFPAGTYTIETDSPIGAIVVIGEYDSYHYVTSASPVGKCELKDGQSFSVQAASITLKPYEGLGY